MTNVSPVDHHGNERSDPAEFIEDAIAQRRVAGDQVVEGRSHRVGLTLDRDRLLAIRHRSQRGVQLRFNHNPTSSTGPGSTSTDDLQLAQLRFRNDTVVPAAGGVVLGLHLIELDDRLAGRASAGLGQVALRQRIVLAVEAAEVVEVTLEVVDTLTDRHHIVGGQRFSDNDLVLLGVLLRPFGEGGELAQVKRVAEGVEVLEDLE